jgi:aminocarboxymuconate-semialdehyde decarboxylase
MDEPGSTSDRPLRLSCRCVDVHTHVVPHAFPAYAGRHAGAPWPTMSPAHSCHRHVLIGGQVYRTVSHQAWDAQVRIADMQRTGVGRQVLSPMPELLSYWLDAEDGAAMCRFLNETIAGLIQQSPTHFSGLAAVPLQDVERAIEVLDEAMHQLNLAGVEIGSNVNGVPIGDPRFRPFFQAASRWGAAVFVHPLRPAGMDRLVGPAALEQVLAFPGEIALAAASMITGGTLAACPGLRIAFSHGAGAFPVLVARLQHAWTLLPALRDAMPEAPQVSARRLFYDELLYDAAAIETLVGLAGHAQVMVGTDYPFVIMDAEPQARVESLAFSEEVKRAIRCDNALRWLGVDGVS